MSERSAEKVNPACAGRGSIHAPHTLAGPGGDKPGAPCDGVPRCDMTLQLLYGSAACDYPMGHDGNHTQAVSGRLWTTEAALDRMEDDDA